MKGEDERTRERVRCDEGKTEKSPILPHLAQNLWNEPSGHMARKTPS